MSIAQNKSQIKSYIEQVEQLNLSNLYPDTPNATQWENMTNSEIETFVAEIMKALSSLKNKMDLLDGIGSNYAQNIENSLANFVNQFGAVKDMQPEQINNQHHQPLAQLNNINNLLRNSCILTELRFEPELKDKFATLKRITPLVENIIKNENKYTQASKSAEEWLKTRQEVLEQIINEHARSFLERAKEHRIWDKTKLFSLESSGKWIWLLGTVVCLTIVGVITYSFSQATSLSPGQAILKVSSIIVPAYLAVFCSNQFLFHKKMYEAYMFKYVTLQTMNNLSKSYPEMQESIFDKCLNVLFSEPSVKDTSRKEDKQLISQLISMLGPQLKKQ